jgi:putative transposase
MSRTRKTYSAELKTKLVLEVIKEEKTLVEIASANKITPKNLQNWKKQFLENAVLAMEPSKVLKEYKQEITKLNVTVDEYAKKVGQLTIEKD